MGTVLGELGFGIDEFRPVSRVQLDCVELGNWPLCIEKGVARARERATLDRQDSENDVLTLRLAAQVVELSPHNLATTELHS